MHPLPPTARTSLPVSFFCSFFPFSLSGDTPYHNCQSLNAFNFLKLVFSTCKSTYFPLLCGSSCLSLSPCVTPGLPHNLSYLPFLLRLCEVLFQVLFGVFLAWRPKQLLQSLLKSWKTLLLWMQCRTYQQLFSISPWLQAEPVFLVLCWPGETVSVGMLFRVVPSSFRRTDSKTLHCPPAHVDHYLWS